MGVRFQVLIATMKQENEDVLKRMNVHCPAVVVNQITARADQHDVAKTIGDVLWIDSQEKGLSRSRNLALHSSEAQYCLLADDDEIFVPHVDRIVINAFEQYPGYDIIAFHVEGIERPFKRKPSKPKEQSLISSMKLSSVQLAFRRDSVIGNDICFDERFGAGSTYVCGEENIFLADCLKKGLHILRVPVTIAYLHMGESSWFTGYNQKYFYSHGAVYHRLSNDSYRLLTLYFVAKLYVKTRGRIDLASAFHWMIAGAESESRSGGLGAVRDNKK